MSNPFQMPHAQCTNCGKMIRGPHKDEIYEDKALYAADAERVYSKEEAEARGLSWNIGSSMCGDCYQSALDSMRGHKRQAAAAKAARVGNRQRIREERNAAQAAHAQQEAARREYEATQQAVQEAEKEEGYAIRARKQYAKRGRLSARKVQSTPDAS